MNTSVSGMACFKGKQWFVTKPTSTYQPLHTVVNSCLQ